MPINSNSNAAQLIASCQGLVRSIAWKIHRRLPASVDLDDLIGYGQIGLAEAARDYNPEKGTQFTTFAYYRVRGAILDGLSKMSWFNQADYARGRYERMADAVLSTEEAQSEENQLDAELRWFRAATTSLGIVYLFSQSQQSDEHQFELESSAQAAPEDDAVRTELLQRLWEAVDQLPEEEQTFIRAAYLEGKSLKEAGERIGIGKAWASRLHAKILQKLSRVLVASSQ